MITQRLNIPKQWHQTYEEFTNTFSRSHVRITDKDDELVWVHSKMGIYNPKEGYLVAYEYKKPAEFVACGIVFGS